MEPNQALEDLRVIRRVMEQTRRSIAMAGAGYFLIIWGVVWLLGFLNSQFLESPLEGWIWLALDVAGVIATLAVGHRLGTRMRVHPGWRVALFWLALFGYGFLWGWLSQPMDAAKSSLYISTVAMFGYVVMGLWLGSRGIAWLGVGVTVLALAGYLLIPAYFFLWMALLGGGALIGSGVYISRRWR